MKSLFLDAAELTLGHARVTGLHKWKLTELCSESRIDVERLAENTIKSKTLDTKK